MNNLVFLCVAFSTLIFLNLLLLRKLLDFENCRFLWFYFLMFGNPGLKIFASCIHKCATSDDIPQSSISLVVRFSGGLGMADG